MLASFYYLKGSHAEDKADLFIVTPNGRAILVKITLGERTQQ